MSKNTLLAELDDFASISKKYPNGTRRVSKKSLRLAEEFAKTYPIYQPQPNFFFDIETRCVFGSWETNNQCVEIIFAAPNSIEVTFEQRAPIKTRRRTFASVSDAVAHIVKHFRYVRLT